MREGVRPLENEELEYTTEGVLKGPKVLLISRLDGWWNFYIDQLVRAFEDCGAKCYPLDYRKKSRGGLWGRWLRKSERHVRSRRTRLIIEKARELQPDLIVTQCRRLDFPHLRESTDARIVFWDIEGPTGGIVCRDVPFDGSVVLMSASKRVAREANEQGTSVHYLAHAADVDVYRPGSVSEAQRRRFESPINFVGTADRRRIEYLESMADRGLSIWGHRWSKRKWRTETLTPCIRERQDIVGDDLVDLYRSTGVFLNILGERHAAERSLLNLQVFAVTATGVCLLTDWTEELEESYDVGTELLTFRDVDELRELSEKFTRDVAKAKCIGERGRARCQAQHTLSHRAARILEFA